MVSRAKDIGRAPRLSRASFLRLAAGAGAALALTPAGGTAGGKMRARAIPKSGELLPLVGLGTYRTFDTPLDDESRARLTSVLRELFAAGGSVIDSSPMYGNSERVVGELLAEMRGRARAFLATKVWTGGRAAGIEQMRDSLRLFRTKRIDLMQVHNLSDWRTQLKTLRKWQAAGTFRYIGVTHYTTGAFDRLETILRKEPMDFLQIPYSIVEREAESRILPLAAEAGVAVLANVPFGKGALFRTVRGKQLPRWAAEFGARTWGQFFLKYLLADKSVWVIPGTSKPHHMADNAAAGLGEMPSPAQRRKMVAFMEGL